MAGEIGMGQKNWGNFSSNIDFLQQTGLLDRKKRILEIGCGKGNLTKALHDEGHVVSAIDASQDALDQCPEGLDIRLADGAELPFDKQAFDLVLSFDVIEHIPDTDRHLEEVRRVLKPRGHYLFQTPNKWTNIPFEMVRWSTTYGVRRTFDFLKPPQHCALHSYSQLKKRLTSHHLDFEFYDVKVVNAYFVQKVRAHLGGVGVALLKVLNPDHFPLAMRTNFYVQSQKRD